MQAAFLWNDQRTSPNWWISVSGLWDATDANRLALVNTVFPGAW